MKKVTLLALFVVFGFLTLVIWDLRTRQEITKPLETILQREKPLAKYTYDALSKTEFGPSAITLGKVVKDESDFSSYVFYFDVGPSVNSGQAKKVSGLINVPTTGGSYPVIVMFRGYVDREKYTTGVGTQHTGEVFAKNGFITLSPDFLGYGESDNPSENAIEERFQTYTTGLTLLASVDNLNQTLSVNNLAARVDATKIGIWGHSNGGQIALSVLEISAKSYPTVLWAPVSKPFPYSILYYTDDFDDHGKLLRKAVAEFEKDYDAELYSLSNFLDRINAPLAIHQGTDDDAVPTRWSDQLVDKLNELNKTVGYFKYPGDDHNLARGWSLAVKGSINFYLDQFKE